MVEEVAITVVDTVATEAVCLVGDHLLKLLLLQPLIPSEGDLPHKQVRVQLHTTITIVGLPRSQSTGTRHQ